MTMVANKPIMAHDLGMSEKHAGGRPTLYSIDVAKTICDRIIEGKSVKKIALMDDMPCEDTIYAWLAIHKEFSELYTQAVEARTNRYMEECVDLADSLPSDVLYYLKDGRVLGHVEYCRLSEAEKVAQEAVIVRATTEMVNVHKLQIDTRLKASAQMNPRKYGTKVDMTTKGDKLPAAAVPEITPDVLAEAMKKFKESV